MEGQNSKKKYNRYRGYRKNAKEASADAAATSENISKILLQTRVISDIEEAEVVIQKIMAESSPVAVDIEGVNLGPKGVITLVQIADSHGTAYIFDVFTTKKMMDGGDSSVIGKLLSSDKILKVVHDCRNDSINLLEQFDIHLRNVFDVQVAHKILELCNGKYERAVYPIGLNPLCKKYGNKNGIGNPLKADMKDIYIKNQKYWQQRPLNDKMKAYAAFDVISLMPCVYETLNSKIPDCERAKFDLLCNEYLQWYSTGSNHFKKESAARDKATFLKKCENLGAFTLSYAEMKIYESLSKVVKERVNLSIDMLKQLENFKLEKLANDKSKSGVA